MPEATLRIGGRTYDVGLNVIRGQYRSLTMYYNERKWIFFTGNRYSRICKNIRSVLNKIQRITVAKVNQIDGEFSCEKLADPDLWKEYIDGDPKLSDVKPEDVFNEFIDATVKTSEHIKRVD